MHTSSLTTTLARLACGGALLAAFLLCSPAPASAQAAECGTRGKRGDGADIQCRLDAVLAKHQAVIGTMKDKLNRCAGSNCEIMQDHLKKIESAQSRAKGQHGRFAAEDFEDLNTTRKSRCKSKNCIETPTDLDVGPETDTGLGPDLADQLDEIGQDLEMTTVMLSEAPTSPAAFAARFSASALPAGFQALYDFKNDPDYPAWLHVADNTQALIPASFAMTFAAQALNKTSSVMENGCQQDIFGTNTSVICLIIDIVAVALDGTAKLLAYNLGDATAWDAKGAYMRAANISHNLGVVDGKVATVSAAVGDTQVLVNNLAAKADEVSKQMVAARQRLIAAQNQIIQLLLTPEGRRSVSAGMLTCDGIKVPCPQVSISCSPTTGLCTYR